MRSDVNRKTNSAISHLRSRRPPFCILVLINAVVDSHSSSTAFLPPRNSVCQKRKVFFNVYIETHLILSDMSMVICINVLSYDKIML